MDKTLLKGLLLIEALAYSEMPRGVTDLSRQLGLTKSNVHRLLQTLCGQGFVKHDPTTGTYSLSLRLWELGCLTLGRLDLKVQAKPYLERLAVLTRETVHLSLLDDADVIYIDKIDSPEPVRAYSRVGGRAPAHCVATGKVLLAFQPPDQGGWPSRGLQRFTSRTITSAADLRRELLRVQELGYSINRGEWRDGVCGLAAPIRDASGVVVAAVGVSGPADRLKPKRLKSLAPAVVDVGAAISRSLGAPRPPSVQDKQAVKKMGRQLNHATAIGR